MFQILSNSPSSEPFKVRLPRFQPAIWSVDDVDSVARVRKKSPVLIPAVGVREMVDRRRTEELLADADADADAVEVIVEPARPTQVRKPEPLRRRLRREPYFGEICWFRNESLL